MARWVKGMSDNEFSALTVHTNSRTQPQTPSLTRLHMNKFDLHLLCGYGRGELCH